jgi:RNA polymerase sigma factor (sigma-70 family)
MRFEDAELLRKYVRENREDAFRELVTRHLDLVWATAQRVTGDGDLARDVAQAVFIDLARKARFISSPVAPWLYKASLLAARKLMRTNLRRTERERLAMETHIAESNGSPTEQEELMPLLDKALADLPEKDRSAVVLRFFARKSLSEVGRSLQISDDAAQKRVSRALEQLRKFFATRGTALTVMGIGTVLTSAGTQSAPAGLTVTVTSGSLAAGTATVSWLWSAQQHLLLMKSKIIIGTIATAALTTPLVMQQQTLASLRAEDRQLQRTNSSETRNVTNTDRTKISAQELAQLRRDREELGRLRAEATRLQNGVDPNVRQELSALQQQIEKARASADYIQTEMAAMQLREDTVKAMQQLGLAARIYATDNSDKLPLTFDAITNILRGALPGKLELDKFEFVKHAREVSEAEPQMLLFREKEARHLPDGSWARSYTFCDGHVEEKTLPEPNFDEWEKEFIAHESTKPQASLQP